MAAAQETSATVSRLGDSSRQIGDVVKAITSIQDDTARAVDAIGPISQIVASINDFQATIAAAVEEEHTATTDEMTRNVTEAAAGSGEIAVNISGVADAAALTTQGAGESQEAVDELARMSADLKVLVGQFSS